jgi:hypothetical protein
MPATDIITLIGQHGSTLGLALFAIWMLNRVWQDRLETEKRHGHERVDAEKQYSEQTKSMYEATQRALESNTRVITRLSEQMRQRGENDERIAQLLIELNR